MFPFVADFNTEPEDQAIVFGQDLFLHCAAVNITTGTSDGLLIQWRLNGSPVSEKASMFSNYTLLVPSVTNSDLGNYTCVVIDDSEEVQLESSPASVSHACKFIVPDKRHSLSEETYFYTKYTKTYLVGTQENYLTQHQKYTFFNKNIDIFLISP